MRPNQRLIEPSDPFDIQAAQASLQTLWEQHGLPNGIIMIQAMRIYEHARSQLGSAPNCYDILPRALADSIGSNLEQISREIALDHAVSLVETSELAAQLETLNQQLSQSHREAPPPEEAHAASIENPQEDNPKDCAIMEAGRPEIREFSQAESFLVVKGCKLNSGRPIVSHNIFCRAL